MTISKVSRGRIGLGMAMALGLTVLAACESSEQKAEKHYQSGIALMEKGDIDRALVELRNVFRLNGRHEQARATYARLVRERGNLREAYGQYLLLVEQYPNNLEGRRALAEMALDSGNWDEVERHGNAALALAPDDPEVQAIAATIAYRKALQARDTEAQEKVLAQANDLVAAHPDLGIARRIVIDGLVRKGDWDTTLAALDEGLKRDPAAKDLNRMRAAALYQLGRMDSLESQLRQMIADDPTDEELQNSLVALFMNQKKPEAAEEFLRSRIDPAGSDPAPRRKLVSFIAQTRGLDAARAELDAIIAANPPRVALYRVTRAGIDFDAGRHDAAIAEMRSIIDSAPEAQDLYTAKVTLARMLATTGNDVGARALVEEVLAADATNVDALKLKANWLIDDDRTGDALVTLRAALEYAPRDPQVMTLMARAHERDGSRDLMGEMLSQAVIAANRAPGESLRYAAFLEQDGKHLPAEDTLVNALRLQPQNADLLAALGRVYVAMKDWPRAEHVERSLRALDTPQATTAANEITAYRLSARSQDKDLTDFLRGLSNDGQGGAGVDIALIRTSILRGDTTGALDLAEKLLAKDPQNPMLRFLHASVRLSAGQAQEGEAELRALVADQPAFEQGWAGLYNLVAASGRREEAAKLLDQGLAAVPDPRMLQWIKAGNLEQAGDIDGAIAIYEALYEKDSNATVIANNLASLIASHRSDPASLDRAYTIARRLRGSDMPAFQDTYGWIAYRRGNLDEALSHLESAAKSLPGDPTVQYHLAVLYGALDRKEDALAILTALEGRADAANPPVWLADVKAEIARLNAPPVAPATPAGNAQTGN